MLLRKVFTALAVPAMILFTISSAMAGGSEEAIEYNDQESNRAV
jgi:hypothetical protein